MQTVNHPVFPFTKKDKTNVGVSLRAAFLTTDYDHNY